MPTALGEPADLVNLDIGIPQAGHGPEVIAV